jgi:phospholipid N-methyltransferase
MRQLSFWDDRPNVSGSCGVRADEQSILQEDQRRITKAAEKCRAAAAALQKHIDLKHKSANGMFVRPPTRKRLSDATGLRNAAIRLERIQITLLRLAEMHEGGTIPPELANLTTRAALESALFTSPGDSPIHTLYKSVTRNENREERVVRLTAEAASLEIPSYFPTPVCIADRLVSMSCIQPDNRVLEPSAGTGNLVDAILKVSHHARVFYCELNCFLLEVLHEKYEGLSNVHFAGRDVCELDGTRVERFDRIIMNPPFESGEDARHIMHAYCALLEKGGILTSLVSAGIFSRRDKEAEAFREFLREQRAVIVDLPAGSFKSSGTAVETKIIQLERQG